MRQDLGFYDDGSAIAQAGDMWPSEVDAALKDGGRVRSDEGTNLAIPIRVRDQIIGVIDGFKGEDGAWSDEEATLMEAVAAQLGLALESARLYQDTQRRAMEERLASDITTSIGQSLEVDRVLQTAAREFGRILGVSEVKIRLTPDEQPVDVASPDVASPDGVHRNG